MARCVPMARSFVVLLLALPFFSGRQDAPCAADSLFKKAPFPVGTALDVEKLKFEERYWIAALAHFNSFTPEKVMKPAFIHPEKDRFYFFETDRLMEFCREKKIRLHGHALLWHNELPRWMEKFRGDAAAWDQMLREHITGIVTHCRETVRSWDVVNEAFNDDGSLRKNIWLDNLGPDYIEKAFRYAGEADPQAKLFYNDFGLESNSQKLKAVISFFSGLGQKGLKIDGIGMQMHVAPDRPAAADITAAAHAIARAGFLVHYSEMDVSLAGYSLFTSSEKLLEAQRRYVREVVSGYLTLPPDARFGITMWGVSDNDSWITQQHFRARPLLFDRRYKPKPAYCGFVEALKSAR